LKSVVTRKSGDITITVTIPAKRVGEAFAEIKKEALKEVSAPGFRKGKAPAGLAEKHLNEDKLSEALFNRLVPPAYAEALQKEGIRPITPPQLKVTSFKKDADLVFEARTAEKPEVKLGDYREALKKLKGKTIYGPDGKPVKGGDRVTAAQVLESLRKTSEIKIPPILADQEVQRMLSSLLRQTQTLGITIEQYLSTEGKNIDQLRKEYLETAERNLKDEFILDEVAKKEGIETEAKEIDDAVKAAPDENSRKAFSEERGRHYIASIIRKRKTIERLLRMAEGKDS
jgi:FKBP-type peptidyl-prolyl cis-trans isomerase (trigger factor)